jgi:hypothetical protein
MSSFARLFAVLSLGLVGSTLVGCGTNHEAFDPGIEVGSGTLKCTARLSPAEFEYSVQTVGDSSGSEVLRMNDVDTGGGNTLYRIGDGAGPYGLWLFSTEDNGRIRMDANLQIGADQVTMMTFCTIEGRTVRATAESAAEIDGGRIRWLDFDEDEVTLDY